ncbi:MAG: hypothetical protein R2737_11915 [Candidatus Nanopelagicales bacterium]
MSTDNDRGPAANDGAGQVGGPGSKGSPPSDLAAAVRGVGAALDELKAAAEAAGQEDRGRVAAALLAAGDRLYESAEAVAG